MIVSGVHRHVSEENEEGLLADSEVPWSSATVLPGTRGQKQCVFLKGCSVSLCSTVNDA